MNVTKETITPRKAIKWLERNVNNRPLSQTWINRLAAAMKSKAWQLNGDCIRFNGNGDLIDGQHRLHACVESGCQFESYVIRGLDHSAFDTIDQGKKRTISDVLARRQHKHYTSLGSALWWLGNYARMLAEDETRLKHDGLRPDQAIELLESNPGLEATVHLATELYRSGRLLPCGMLGFLIHECGRVNPKHAIDFWTGVSTGTGLTSGMPAHTLNRRLTLDLKSVAKMDKFTMCAIAIKAWNAHRDGRSIGTLKFSFSEEFPRIKH